MKGVDLDLLSINMTGVLKTSFPEDFYRYFETDDGMMWLTQTTKQRYCYELVDFIISYQELKKTVLFYTLEYRQSIIRDDTPVIHSLADIPSAIPENSAAEFGLKSLKLPTPKNNDSLDHESYLKNKKQQTHNIKTHDAQFCRFLPTLNDPMPANYRTEDRQVIQALNPIKPIISSLFDHLGNILKSNVSKAENQSGRRYKSKGSIFNHHTNRYIGNFQKTSPSNLPNSRKSNSSGTDNDPFDIETRKFRKPAPCTKAQSLVSWERSNPSRPTKSATLVRKQSSIESLCNKVFSETFALPLPSTISESLAGSILRSFGRHSPQIHCDDSAKPSNLPQIKDYLSFVSKAPLPQPLFPYYTSLFQTFIIGNSEYTLNISGTLRNVICKMFDKKYLTYGMFDTVLECVLEMIYTNVYIPNLASKK